MGDKLLSIIVPASDSEVTLKLKNELLRCSYLPGVEVIFIATNEAHSRAERINLGVRRSIGEMILLYHPRSIVAAEGIEYLRQLSINKSHDKIWGGFTHRFDVDHILLKFTSWYSNNIRGSIRGILYLDHCIFFEKSLWQELPSVDIFEDTILSQNLNRYGKPIILKYLSTTSAIRFIKNGIVRQSISNQFFKLGFFLGLSHSTMNKFYEYGLDLNSKYPKSKRKM